MNKINKIIVIGAPSIAVHIARSGKRVLLLGIESSQNLHVNIKEELYKLSNAPTLVHQDILDSIEKVVLGPERKSHVMSEEEKKITAYHEAGHALVGHFLPNCDPIHKVSIISRGRAAGYTMNLPEKDKHLHTKSKFADDISMMLGGLVAEQIVFKENSNGASSDLKQVSNLAKQIITKFGMNDDLGYRSFGQGEGMVFLGKEIHERKDYSEKTAENIDEEIKKLVDSCYQKAKEIITENRDILDRITNVLLEKETIEREDFEKLVGQKEK